MEAGCLLIGVCKGSQLRILVVPGKKGERNRRPWPADIVVVAVVDRGRFGSVGAAQSIGQDQCRMACKIGCDQLRVGTRSNNNVHLLKERRDLLNGQRPRAVSLDIFDRRIEACDAEGVRPILNALLGQPLITPGECRSSKAAAASAVSSGTIAS